MKDGDLFAKSPDFVGLRSVYRGCVTYGTIHASCGLGFPTAQIHVSRNRNSTSQRITKWAVFMGLCECSEVIHSHLASCYSQIFSDLTKGLLQRQRWRNLDGKESRITTEFRASPDQDSSRMIGVL